MGYIDEDCLRNCAEPLASNEYRQYLLRFWANRINEKDPANRYQRQLGWELLRTCAPLGEIVALDYPAVDLSDSTGLRELVRTVKPDIIINAAAYTNVDKAESELNLRGN